MKDIREVLFSLRSYTPIPFLVLGLIFGHPSIISIVIGFIVALTGLIVRFWAVGHAHYETRATRSVGASRLVTSGPFAFVRNPLYISNILLYTGFAVMANLPWLIIATAVWFIVQYTLIVSREEEFLQKEFGAEYDEYRKNVFRFFPRLTPYTRGGAGHIDTKIAWRSERRTHQAFAITLTLMIGKYLWNVFAA